MPRLLLVFFALALYISGFVHCSMTSKELMPSRLPKWVWLALTICVPLIGSALWFFVVYNHSRRQPKKESKDIAPDDDPDFLAKLDNYQQFYEWERSRKEEQDKDDKDDDKQEDSRGEK
ncbi:MAG: PLDc_N domain-containing protein [Actinomycetaceae bacterium]|nr:PLDc_N domain-containing protein [Actinomycetaceae bacterium]